MRGSGADCWRCDAFAKSVITWPRVCEGCPTICQPYTSLSPVSRLPCYAAAGPKGRRLRTSRRWRKFRGQPRAVFTQGGPPARSASPIVRMSAEQPRLALADLTKKLPESIARASSAKSVARQGQALLPTPGNRIFWDLLASMATVIIARAPAINKQAVIACCCSGRPKTSFDGCKAASGSARKK